MLGSILRLLIAFSNCLNSGFLFVDLTEFSQSFSDFCLFSCWSTSVSGEWSNGSCSGVQDHVFLNGIFEFEFELDSKSSSSSSFSKSVGKSLSSSPSSSSAMMSSSEKYIFIFFCLKTLLMFSSWKVCFYWINEFS